MHVSAFVALVWSIIHEIRSISFFYGSCNIVHPHPIKRVLITIFTLSENYLERMTTTTALRTLIDKFGHLLLNVDNSQWRPNL